MHRTVTSLLVACALATLPHAAVHAQDANATPGTFTPHSGQAGKDVVWVPTPQALVDRMLDMAEVKPGEELIDLGSGDGRTVITAARRGIKASGIEYNPDMVALSRRNAQEAGVGDRATFVQGDIFQSDFSRAQVITLFLLPALNVRLRPILLDMPPGTRVVSNSFDMGEWEPDQSVEAARDCVSWCRAFKWVVPAKVAGDWLLGDGTLRLTQTFQKLDGSLTRGSATDPVSAAKMQGSEIAFTVAGRRYQGRVDGATMTGTVEGGGSFTAKRAG